MKKLCIASLVVGLLMAFALPALAQSTEPTPDDCNVAFNVDVNKIKNIVINKVVNKAFNFNLDLQVTIAGFPQWAEVEVTKCDHNIGNTVTLTSMKSADNITNSFNTFTGIVQVNQAAGILNNQGNVMAAGITDKTGDQQTFGVSMVEAAVEKTNIGNILVVTNIVTLDSIVSSFNSLTGLAQVNQAAGILNNQNNVLVLGKNLNTTGLVAENDTFLSMENSGNIAQLTNITTTATISSSFNGFTGAAQVNQAPGKLNNQANIISIAHAGP